MAPTLSALPDWRNVLARDHWHLLQGPEARFHDLCPEHFSHRLDPDASKLNHVRQLEALGYTVSLTPAA